MAFSIGIDAGLLRRGLRSASLAHRRLAYLYTEARKWEGRVLVSKRNRQEGDPKGRVAHGRAIANMLRDQGHDLFGLPKSAIEAASKIYERRMAELVRLAARRRVDRNAVKDAYAEVAAALADAHEAHIAAGRAGQNTEASRKAKLRGLERGTVTREYGEPPPYGIRSGRFIRGIKSQAGRDVGSLVRTSQ